MKRLFLLVPLVWSLSPFVAIGLALNVLSAQEKPAPSKPLKGDDEIRANIRELQLEQKDLVYRFNQCSEVVRTGQVDFNSISLKIQGEVAKAFARAKLSQDEYDLNLETFTFAKKLSKPAPPPEKKP